MYEGKLDYGLYDYFENLYQKIKNRPKSLKYKPAENWRACWVIREARGIPVLRG